MVKRYKTVIFPRQLKYNFYSTTEPGRYASVATILDPTFYKLYLLTISLAQRRYSCFSRLISVKGLGPVILPWKYQFSSDHWSKTWPGEVSTSMGDRLGIPRAGPVFLNSVSTKFKPYIYSFINKHKVSLSPNLNIQPIIFFLWIYLKIHMDGNIKPKNKCTKYKLEISTWSKKKLTAPPPVF